MNISFIRIKRARHSIEGAYRSTHVKIELTAKPFKLKKDVRWVGRYPTKERAIADAKKYIEDNDLKVRIWASH